MRRTEGASDCGGAPGGGIGGKLEPALPPTTFSISPQLSTAARESEHQQLDSGSVSAALNPMRQASCRFVDSKTHCRFHSGVWLIECNSRY